MALKFSTEAAHAAIIPHQPPVEAEVRFGVSEKAAKRLSEIVKTEPPGSMLRIAVEGGGCSGFQYKFAFTTEVGPDDARITRDGVTVLVDEVSLPLLAGSELDFVTELLGQSFQIRNPNAKAACGCGTSFSV